MAEQITHYKIFIASPGGLENERNAFKHCLTVHNEADALERSCYFQPVGWEITLGGVGRPQERINQDLRKCDYFVLVLWNRWGSATGKEDVSSGTHEEYLLAHELLQDPTAPMREIIVFFRGIDASLLSDPGPQLRKVLEFKRQLEDEKNLLFETFDSPESFSDKLKRHLASWTREHECAGKSSASELESESESESEVALDSLPEQNEDLGKIDLEESTSPTDLESKLAFDVTTIRTMPAFDRYGKFLLGQERYSDAERLYREMYELASNTSNKSWAATALMRIGGVYRVQGKTQDAESILKKALLMKQESNDKVGESRILTILADIYSHSKPGPAIEHYLAALEANPDLKDPALSTIKYRVGKAYAELGNSDLARSFLDEAFVGATKTQNTKLLGAIKQVRKFRKLNPPSKPKARRHEQS